MSYISSFARWLIYLVTTINEIFLNDDIFYPVIVGKETVKFKLLNSPITFNSF